MRGLVVTALLVLAACSRNAPEDLEALRRTVQANVEAGDFGRAADGAEHGLALAAKRHDQPAEWRFRLQRAEVLLFSRRAESALTLLDAPIPPAAGYGRVAAHRLLLQSRAHSMLSHPADSNRLLDEAQAAATAENATDLLAEIELIRGNRLDTQGKYTESVAAWQRARDLAQSIHSSYLEAGALINLGFSRFRFSRWDEASRYFDEVVRIAGPERSAMYAVAQLNLSICYSGLGEFDKAIAVSREAVARHERSGAQAYLAGALGELGRAYLLKGDLKQAAANMDRALTLSLDMNSNHDAAVWANNLSNVYLELGDLRNAETLNQESRRLRASDKVPAVWYNDLNSARIAQAKGDRAEAERCYRLAMTTGKNDPSIQWDAEEGLGTLALSAGSPTQAARHFEAALVTVEQARASLDSTEFKLPFLTRLIRLYGQYVDTLLRLGESEKALAVADSSRAQVLAERSGSGPVRRLRSGTYRDEARAAKAILLSYWLGPERSHAWVVNDREVHHVELPPAREIEALVAIYQEAVERQLADPARSGLPAGQKLFATLIEPVRKWIPNGAHVIVTPDGALHGVNLESLPEPGGEPRYWVEDVTLSIAPSLALLKGQAASPAMEVKRLLLIGDPVGVDKSYPPLTYAAAEIDGITEKYGKSRSVIVSREKARPEAWGESKPGQFAAIHFTAHATANRESPLESAVLLSGGKLYARDVMASQLAADLVTVSACRGAGTRLYSGEGLVGFAWAFLHAGARNVIAGLWDVNDQSTSKLMNKLYEGLAKGETPAAALHAAKLELVHSKGNLSKPYYWAPFQHYSVAP